MIYRNALLSSTGLVIYQRNQHSIREHNGPDLKFKLYAASPPHSQHYDPLPQEPINIALLQTCSDIYNETKNLLWAYNVLIFSPADLPGLGQQLRVQHVLLQYRLDEDDRRGPSPLHRTLDVLGRWAQQGSLKSITLRTREPLRHPYDNQQFLEGIISGHLARWRASTSVGGPLHNIFRMVIFTGINLLALSNGCRPIVKLEEIQKEVHAAMGGEIWTEGVLTWKDGVQISSPASAFEWVGGPGLWRPRISAAVQREIDALPDLFDYYSTPR